MQKVVIIGLGGFIGSTLRYFISIFVQKVFGADFPYGTLVVNFLGSFLIGLFIGLINKGLILSANLKIFVSIGVLGSFTTFSSFSYETIELLRHGAINAGLANIIYTLLCCFLATWFGEAISRLALKIMDVFA